MKLLPSEVLKDRLLTACTIPEIQNYLGNHTMDHIRANIRPDFIDDVVVQLDDIVWEEEDVFLFLGNGT